MSRLKSVTKCGRRFQLEKVEKVPSRPAAWTIRGIAAHSTIEEWEKSGRTIDPEATYQDQHWPEAFRKICDEYPDVDDWIRTPRVKTTARDLQLREADGLTQVQKYVERALDEEDLWRVVESEVDFKMEFPEFFVVGYIDQIREWHDGFQYIVDVKTGGDDQEDNRQLGIYALGYESKTGVRLDTGQYYYTKLNRPSDDIDLRPYTREYIHGEFLTLDKILSQNLFLANPSIKNCFSCNVSRHCAESKWND